MTISHLPALFSPPTPPTAPPPTPSRPFRPLLRRALAPTRRGRPPPSCCLALALFFPCHAPRRFQNHPVGRHRDAAVERPLQSTPPSSSERPRTTRVPELDFARPFALSSLPRRRTPPPPCLNPGELHPTAEPPTQTRSTPTSPTISTASTSHSSQAISPHPNTAGATPPPCSEPASRRSPSTPPLRPP